MSKYLLIYTTCPNKKTAKSLAKIILKHHLAACCNISKIESIYLENSEIKSSKEFSLLIKTKKDQLIKIEQLIEKFHPYEIPVILNYPVNFNKLSNNWLNNSIK